MIYGGWITKSQFQNKAALIDEKIVEYKGYR